MKLTKKSFKPLVQAICFILMLQSISPTHAHLPDLGNEHREAVSVDDEKFIGATWMREIRGTGMVSQDLLVNEYIKHLGNKLIPYVDMPYNDIKIKFFVINDKTINAFAFFGGHVAVFTGLIYASESESELAGAMAHELAHISQEHILQQITDNKRMMPITLGGALAAAIIGMPELIVPVLAGYGQHQLNFSRQHEQEADRIGMQILAKAKFDPHGLPNMFERMSNSSRFDNKPPEYLLTHPLYDTRISDTRSRAETYVYRQRPNSQMYNLVRARIEVKSASNILELIKNYEQKLQTKRVVNELATRYAYAYALAEADKHQAAYNAILPLANEHPEDLIIQVTAAEIERSNHMPQAAKIRLEKLAKLYPDSVSVILHYADLMIVLKQPKLALKTLQHFKTIHEPEPVYYELLRHAEGMLGNQIGVFEANAEWYMLNGDTENAMKQLKMALDLNAKKDERIKARLETRLEQMAALLEREKKI
jgi:predicted Zn-dependent protease